jgi:threonine synthase
MDLLKDLFADPSNSPEAHLSQFNKYFEDIGQITYYFASYFSLIRSGTFNPLTNHIHFVVPCGNFEPDSLRSECLPISKLIIATNENDVHCFWQTGAYEKQGVHSTSADGFNAHSKGVRETLSPAMDILISSNFERLLCLHL